MSSLQSRFESFRGGDRQMDAEVSKALQVTRGMPECRETGDRNGNRKRKARTRAQRKKDTGIEGVGGGERQAEGENAESN